MVFRFRNAQIEITSTDVGVFEVKGRVLGVALDKFELVFQVKIPREGKSTFQIVYKSFIN